VTCVDYTFNNFVHGVLMLQRLRLLLRLQCDTTLQHNVIMLNSS
jgi:hypothetical protein